MSMKHTVAPFLFRQESAPRLKYKLGFIVCIVSANLPVCLVPPDPEQVHIVDLGAVGHKRAHSHILKAMILRGIGGALSAVCAQCNYLGV